MGLYEVPLPGCRPGLITEKGKAVGYTIAAESKFRHQRTAKC